jgi:hemerythrin-like metal-binding protein
MMTEEKPASPETITWTDKFLLGFEPMDKVHEEFVDVVGRLQTAADAEVPALLDEFARHAQAHFDMENTWMNETEFPARDCHIDEHAAVMRSVVEVQEQVAAGNIAIARDLARELAKWFPGHADYLDSALSHWMCKRRLGGKPIVIRRSVGQR